MSSRIVSYEAHFTRVDDRLSKQRSRPGMDQAERLLPDQVKSRGLPEQLGDRQGAPVPVRTKSMNDSSSGTVQKAPVREFRSPSIENFKAIPRGDYAACHRFFQRYPRNLEFAEDDLYADALDSLAIGKETRASDNKEARAEWLVQQALMYRTWKRLTKSNTTARDKFFTALEDDHSQQREFLKIELKDMMIFLVRRQGRSWLETYRPAEQPATHPTDSANSEEAAQFFKEGRVFAVLNYRSMSSNKASRHDSDIRPYVRHLVVVRPRRGCCVCIPINTYGGKGLKAIGEFRDEIDDHAVIHMSNAGETYMDEGGLEEPRSTKKAIEVDPDKDQTLHPASRLNFARPDTVDHAQKVVGIGRVANNSLSRLRDYFAKSR